MDSSAVPISHPANGLQDFIAISRYARYSPELRRRETWAEAIGRVGDMHLSHYPDASFRMNARTGSRQMQDVVGNPAGNVT